MPVDTHVDLDDTISVEPGGMKKGKRRYTLLDGRHKDVNMRAIDDTAWTALSLAKVASVEAEFTAEDAAVGANDENQDVEAGGEADVWDKAVAKIRNANRTGKPLKAYNLMDKVFTTLRLQQGQPPPLTQGQVETRLKTHGMTDAEHAWAFDRWTELKKPDNQTKMIDYEDVLTLNSWGTELRAREGAK